MDPLNEKKIDRGSLTVVFFEGEDWQPIYWNEVPFSSWSTIRTPALSDLKRMKQNKLVFILRTIQALD